MGKWTEVKKITKQCDSCDLLLLLTGRLSATSPVEKQLAFHPTLENILRKVAKYSIITRLGNLLLLMSVICIC